MVMTGGSFARYEVRWIDLICGSLAGQTSLSLVAVDNSFDRNHNYFKHAARRTIASQLVQC